ncbi:MAG: glycosyl transferase family 2, partial [Thermoanaerobaculia bacterium]
VIRERIGWQRLAVIDFPLFFGATLSFVAFYVCSQREIGRGWRETLRTLPWLLSLGIGLSVNNVRAVLEALAGRGSEFTRTPKYRIEGKSGQWRDKKYRAAGTASTAGEVLLAAYFLGAIVFAAVEDYWLGIPFLLVFFNGFAYTAALSLLSRRAGQPAASPPQPAPSFAAS